MRPPQWPAHRTRCEQLLVAVTVAEVSRVGAKVTPWLRCFGGKLHKLDKSPQPPAAAQYASCWGYGERPVGDRLLSGAGLGLRPAEGLPPPLPFWEKAWCDVRHRKPQLPALPHECILWFPSPALLPEEGQSGSSRSWGGATSRLPERPEAPALAV